VSEKRTDAELVREWARDLDTGCRHRRGGHNSDLLRRLAAQSEERDQLLKATSKYLVDIGPCDEATQPDETPLCGDETCSYCELAVFVQEALDGE